VSWLLVADHLGIERRGGEGVLQLCVAMFVWPLLGVGVCSVDHQDCWGGLQFLYVWDPEVHEVLLLALLVMAIAVLSGARVHLILAEQGLQGK
jgi:hypothetical protein